MSHNCTTQRISSIDALRGIVLFGIFLVHTGNGFGFKFETYGLIHTVIMLFLTSRCAPIFSILFGVSFYLILRNGKTSNYKFLWRCCLLMLFGLFNNMFYSYDVLMWYGLWGMFLIPFRNKSLKTIFLCSISCSLLSMVLSYMCLEDLFFPNYVNDRYVSGASLSSVVSYPLWKSIQTFLYTVLNAGILHTFSYFLFGYFLAKAGIIENMKDYIGRINIKKMLCVGLVIYVLYGLYMLYVMCCGEVGMRCFGYVFSTFFSLFYAVLFLYLYHQLDGRGFKYLEAYGKLGLTNYSAQSIFGVVIIYAYILPNSYSFDVLFACALSFFLFQCVFSFLWLKYFKYGPLEYLWRSLTNLRFNSPFK